MAVKQVGGGFENDEMKLPKFWEWSSLRSICLSLKVFPIRDGWRKEISFKEFLLNSESKFKSFFDHHCIGGVSVEVLGVIYDTPYTFASF